ncbi:MAG: type IV toxin-antitoxin system AbiEi family antitoxin domain-containing protein [Nitrospirae bacterium]|nr:type IV toxin-antitoxin system AbiEi family antitoxin domain-containing protein [Nitrospirota bacterium]
MEETQTHGFFRTRDLETLGLSFVKLRQLIEDGTVERITRGLYRSVKTELTEHHTLAAVCARIPNGIICLLSALRYHDIGTQLPREVWLAIPHKARAPKLPEFPIRLIRFSGPSLQYGVISVTLEGIKANITSPARTVVDCFRFRRLVGRDVALEAMRETLREKKATPDEIWRAAEICRAKSLVGPYLEVMR